MCGQGAQLYDAGADRLLWSVTLDRELAETALGKIEAEVGQLYAAVDQDGVGRADAHRAGLPDAAPHAARRYGSAGATTCGASRSARCCCAIPSCPTTSWRRRPAGWSVRWPPSPCRGRAPSNSSHAGSPRRRGWRWPPSTWDCGPRAPSPSGTCPTTSPCSTGPRTASPWPTPTPNSRRWPTRSRRRTRTTASPSSSNDCSRRALNPGDRTEAARTQGRGAAGPGRSPARSAQYALKTLSIEPYRAAA